MVIDVERSPANGTNYIDENKVIVLNFSSPYTHHHHYNTNLDVNQIINYSVTLCKYKTWKNLIRKVLK